MSKENKRLAVIVGICLLVLLGAILAVILLEPGEPAPDQNTVPTGGQLASDPTDPSASAPTTPNGSDPTKPTQPDSTEPGAPETTDPPPVVEIPDVDDGEEGLQFPCEIPGYDLQIEKLAAYTGLFVEDGTNAEVDSVAMLLLHNKSDKAVEYTEITVKYQNETLAFHVTALPAGARMVVQEKDCKKLPDSVPLEAQALIVQRAEMDIAEGISVTENEDNSLTVKNLTGEEIPAVRVFYKYYMEEEELYVGGIAFTVRIAGLGANSSVVVSPSHYVSKTSRVVMALTYDS